MAYLPVLLGALAAFSWGTSDYLSRSSSQKVRSEEHTSELQSQSNLVCRLLLDKKQANVILQPGNARDSDTRSAKEPAHPPPLTDPPFEIEIARPAHRGSCVARYAVVACLAHGS